MSCAWRTQYEGTLCHLLSGDNERREIFKDDDDRLLFLDVLGQLADRFQLEVFALVLNPSYSGAGRVGQAAIPQQRQMTHHADPETLLAHAAR